jgi:hypothetical protein
MRPSMLAGLPGDPRRAPRVASGRRAGMWPDDAVGRALWNSPRARQERLLGQFVVSVSSKRADGQEDKPDNLSRQSVGASSKQLSVSPDILVALGFCPTWDKIRCPPLSFLPEHLAPGAAGRYRPSAWKGRQGG